MSWVDRLLHRRMDRREQARASEQEAAAATSAPAGTPSDTARPATSGTGTGARLPQATREALAAAGMQVDGQRGERGGVIGRRPGATGAVDPTSPEAIARRQSRLNRRLRDLRYDLGQADAAHREPNRWTERVEELTTAIDQAERDERTALQVAPGWSSYPLPATPLTIERVRVEEPAEVRFRIGAEAFIYSEDIDWAERGHQKADVPLRRTGGEIAALLPDSVPQERHADLHEHLAHGLGTFAEALRDAELERVASGGAQATNPAVTTLADLAQPCPICGGWRDFRGRCPACQQREWLAEQLRAERQRLVKERNEQQQELARMRERRGLLLRQIADTEAELELLTVATAAPPTTD